MIQSKGLNYIIPIKVAGQKWVFSDDSEGSSVPLNRSRARLLDLKRNYELDFEKLDAIIQKQSGLCLLCSQPLGADVCVDHVHDDNPEAPIEVRGALHKSCNMVLGLIEKRGPFWLQNAADYLGWNLFTEARRAGFRSGLSYGKQRKRANRRYQEAVQLRSGSVSDQSGQKA